MKRITLISALCLAALAVPAGPAAAAPLTFSATVRADQSVSLFASNAACRFRPCTYTWAIDGVRAGATRSLVVQLAAGCHTVVLRMSERKFRNPTSFTGRVMRTICIGEAGTGASEVGELSEAPADPPVSEPDTPDVPEEVTDSTDVPPADTGTPPVTETTTDGPPADTTAVTEGAP